MAGDGRTEETDRVEARGRLNALERGLAAAVERIERLEGEVLPRAVPDYDDAEEREPFERTMPLPPAP
jgi:hypothetical protein